MMYFLTNGKQVKPTVSTDKKLMDKLCQKENETMTKMDIMGPRWEVWSFDASRLSLTELLGFVEKKHPAVEKVRWF